MVSLNPAWGRILGCPRRPGPGRPAIGTAGVVGSEQRPDHALLDCLGASDGAVDHLLPVKGGSGPSSRPVAEAAFAGKFPGA